MFKFVITFVMVYHTIVTLFNAFYQKRLNSECIVWEPNIQKFQEKGSSVTLNSIVGFLLKCLKLCIPIIHQPQTQKTKKNCIN